MIQGVGTVVEDRPLRETGQDLYEKFGQYEPMAPIEAGSAIVVDG